MTEEILTDYQGVLSRPELRIRRGLRQQLMQLIRNGTHPVIPVRALHIMSDPGDEKFAECADTARADYLATGNQKHFRPFWKTTKVISSREFITLIASHLLS